MSDMPSAAEPDDTARTSQGWDRASVDWEANDPSDRPAAGDGEREGLLPGRVAESTELTSPAGHVRARVAIAFVLFGLINNCLYVVILSAALDLVPRDTPKGVVAFANITPALIAKVGWPYFSTGPARYRLRIPSCSILSFVGMVIVAVSSSVTGRLAGIAVASFSSGLGELTYLQLSTNLSNDPSRREGRKPLSALAIAYFATGTGAAGIVGAALWWLIRGWGVTRALVACSLLPFIMSLAYFTILPHPPTTSTAAYVPLPPDDLAPFPTGERLDAPELVVLAERSLDLKAKYALARPLIWRFMVPLFTVYAAEYTINQGVAVTLLYPPASPSEHPILGHLIRDLKDHYPLYQLVYQIFVFISRSSHTLHVPPIPSYLLSLPAFLQCIILAVLSLESALAIFPQSIALNLVILLISIEGLCGGSAYVNTFYYMGSRGEELHLSPEEKEFSMGVVGLADSLGIVVASLLAMPVEIGLCEAQARAGRGLCKQV